MEDIKDKKTIEKDQETILKEQQELIEKLEAEKKLLAQKIAGEKWDDKDIEDIKIVVKEKEKPGIIPLGRGGKLHVPTFIIDKAGKKFMIRVASTDASKLQGWLWDGYTKCTYGEVGITDKRVFKGAPLSTAMIGEDMIVLKIPVELWEEHMRDKSQHKKNMAKAMLHSTRDDINKTGKDLYGARVNIARGDSLDEKKIENM